MWIAGLRLQSAGRASALQRLVGDSELGFALWRLVVGAIRGLEDQPVVSRRKALHLNDQSERNDGVAFLDVLLERDRAGKENLLVRCIEDAVTRHHVRRRVGLKQRLVDLR